MKVIDLLNKIANGEIKTGFKIKNKKGDIYEYIEGKNYFVNVKDKQYIWGLGDFTKLNNEIEIIEEDKEIEEVSGIELLGQCDNWLQKRDVNIKSDFELNLYILEAINRNFKGLYHKQCELIKAVNELKKGK